MARLRRVLGIGAYAVIGGLAGSCTAFKSSPEPVPGPLHLPVPLAREAGLAAQPGPDRTLHVMQTASLAIWYADPILAESQLDAAIGDIETLYVGSDNAAVQARKLYHEEREKPFKGEPYERMMAYLYRGLLDFGAGDYNNAAASFRTAILQDAFADEQQDQCDFELPEYLLALSITKGGGDKRLAKEAYDRAVEIARAHKTTIPPLRPQDNVLLFIEVGPSPFKVAQGEEDELLVIGRKGGDGMGATVTVDRNPPLATNETANLAYQAMTRGGRQFDFILAGKAYSKQLTSRGGLTVNQIGTAISFVLPPVGGPIQLAGLMIKAAGIGIKPRADTRYWSKLPDSIHVVSMQLAPGQHMVRIAFHDQFGEHLEDADVVFDLDVTPSAREVLLWASSQDQWPERTLNLG